MAEKKAKDDDQTIPDRVPPDWDIWSSGECAAYLEEQAASTELDTLLHTLPEGEETKSVMMEIEAAASGVACAKVDLKFAHLRRLRPDLTDLFE